MSKHNVSLMEQIGDKMTVGTVEECWTWLACKQSGGRAQLRWRGRMESVYVLMYEEFIGPVPPGMILDHVCHNEAALRGECDGGDDCPHHACCNPYHLTSKSQGQNLLDSPLTQASINKAKTHCDRGHEFNEENTGFKNNGRWRYCKPCNKMGKDGRAAWDAEHGVS